MSEYSYVEGTYNFETKADLNTATDQMDAWINEDGTCVDHDELAIEVQFDFYRNLHRHIEDIGENAAEYQFVGACGDGSLYGFTVTSDNGYTEYDLREWAVENGHGDEPECETVEDYHEHTDWILSVIQDFMDTMMGEICG